MKNKDDVESFAAKLHYFGGRISFVGEFSFNNVYLDVEEFFLESTCFINYDERLTSALEHWVYQFGALLSPSKLRRIVKSGKEFDPQVLGIWISRIEENNYTQSNFSILAPYCKKIRNKKNLFDIPFKLKRVDSLWENYGLLKVPFQKDMVKYIRPISYYKKNCPELFYRIQGLSQVDSDIKAYCLKVKKKSLYQIAKDIFSDYSRVYKSFQRLSFLQQI